MISERVSQAVADGIRHTARLFAPTPTAPRVDLAGRTFVVTGASPGSLGYAVAHALASWGGQVVATCRRNPAALERSLARDPSLRGAHGSVIVRRLDLADRASVETFAHWAEAHFANRLHVLVNNAGILEGMFSRGETPLAADGTEIHWRTNYLGAFHLSRLLLPMLIRAGHESGDARLVNVASHQHVRGRNEQLSQPTRPRSTWEAYGLSKLAMLHMSAEFHRRYGGAGDFRAVALHPGTVYTNMIAEGLASSPRATVIALPLGDALRPALQRMARLALLTPRDGAQTVLWCATATGVEGGRYYERCAPARPSAAALDEDVGAWLWEASERWVESGVGDG